MAPGSPGSRLAGVLVSAGAPDLDPGWLLDGKPQRLGPAEYALYKPRWGAFYRTPLETLLGELSVDTVVVGGCNFPNCPRATIVEASERDYRIVLATDAVSRASTHGLAEVAGIGVLLMPSDDIVAGLAGANAAGASTDETARRGARRGGRRRVGPQLRDDPLTSRHRGVCAVVAARARFDS